MKTPIKRTVLLILCAALLLPLLPQSVTASETAAAVQYETMSIGAGAAFFSPLINPTDSNNFAVLSDMNDVYYSLDAGKSWSRTETMTNFFSACFSDDGTLYVGGTGLYASRDKGQTLTAIYPRQEDIRAISSRYGRNMQVILADGYDSGHVTCMDTLGDRVYFVTLDWSTSRTFQLLSCTSDGADLKKHLVYETFMSSSPQDVRYQLLATEQGLYFSSGSTLYFYSFTTGVMFPVYFAQGTILDLEQIGQYIFILDDTKTQTKVLYTEDMVTFRNLLEHNTLPNSFERYGYTQYFQWHFKAISGNDMDSIFLSFTSPVQWTGAPIDDLAGVMKFDGEQFHWVFDPIFRNRGSYNLQGWSFGSYHPINGICIDPKDSDHCIMANIDTLYDIHFGQEEQDVQYLHCNVKTIDGQRYYTSTGLDAQSTAFVRVDPFDPRHILIPSSDLGLQISVDGGESFRRMAIAEKYTDLYIACYDVYFDPNTPGLVYGLWSNRHDAPYIPALSDKNAHGHFAVSRDGGLNWDFTYSTGLPENSIPVRMSVEENGDELTIAVATYNNGFFISEDSGRTFTGISGQMDSHEGLIWGQDVVLTEDSVYCLTAWHTFGGSTPSVLYRVDRTTGETSRVDLGRVVNARSLDYDETHGLYLSAIHNTTWGWRMDLGASFDVNTDGGVYRVEDNNTLSLVLPVELGASSCGFTPDGTMYVVADKGMVYVKSPGDADFRLYAEGLFTRLMNLTFSPDYRTLYITTQGGGAYRMNAAEPEKTTYTVTFRDYDGTILAQQKVPEGSSAQCPPDPCREPDEEFCYTFLGWDQDTTAVYADLEVTAVYEAREHLPVIENEIPATCQQEGYSGDSYCAYCHLLLAEGQVLEQLPHEFSRYSNNADGTHTGYCATCGEPAEPELCYLEDGVCVLCGHRYETPDGEKKLRRFTISSQTINGESYLLYSNSCALGTSLTPERVNLRWWLDGSVLGSDIGGDMLWTYRDGLLYTVEDGRVTYLTITKTRGCYRVSLTHDPDLAVHWNYRGGSLCTIVLENGQSGYRYLRITEQGIGLSTMPAWLVLCQLYPEA
ncbi:MAG: hypothetical protein E7459_08005 [Ruminococcaceae bacterium]|nr:hypothetical protein [Oscillospiraceae bacterium]